MVAKLLRALLHKNLIDARVLVYRVTKTKRAHHASSSVRTLSFGREHINSEYFPQER